MSIRLICSNNSVRNTTVSCDSLGIHYEISKSQGIVTVKRWDSPTNTSIVVGEFELPIFKRDRIRLGGDKGEWRLLDEVLYKNRGSIFSTARTFIGNDGKHYRWKIRWHILTLCEDTGEGNQPALVTYHRRYKIAKKQSFLEVSDPSILKSLDNIVTMFLIMEKKRRDRDKRRRRYHGGG